MLGVTQKWAMDGYRLSPRYLYLQHCNLPITMGFYADQPCGIFKNRYGFFTLYFFSENFSSQHQKRKGNLQEMVYIQYQKREQPSTPSILEFDFEFLPSSQLCSHQNSRKHTVNCEAERGSSEDGRSSRGFLFHSRAIGFVSDTSCSSPQTQYCIVASLQEVCSNAGYHKQTYGFP